VSQNLIERFDEARKSGDPSRLNDIVPYSKFMGITMSLIDGELRGRMAYAPHLVGNSSLPALHGGTLAALLESTAIFQILWDAETVVLPKTINVTIDYLRSGKPVDTWARGIITRHGRRVANVRAEAWQDDPASPIAIAHAHFLILPAD
jgi:acyl-coenzyme A thioesterase PaaI-like protein